MLVSDSRKIGDLARRAMSVRRQCHSTNVEALTPLGNDRDSAVGQLHPDIGADRQGVLSAVRDDEHLADAAGDLVLYMGTEIGRFPDLGLDGWIRRCPRAD